MKSKILIVDDDPAIRLAMHEFLETEQWSADTAGSAEAVSIVRADATGKAVSSTPRRDSRRWRRLRASVIRLDSVRSFSPNRRAAST